MASYLVPPNDHSTYQHAKLAPSVAPRMAAMNGNGVHAKENPTVLPLSVLKQFQFAFLIRNPRKAVPSYYRCCIPPLNDMTGFKYFMPNEAGYRELRALFDYLLEEGVIEHPLKGNMGSATNDANGNAHANGARETNGAKQTNGSAGTKYRACVIDADDLLDHPKEIVQRFCEMVGLDFDESMLEWNANKGCESFDKWKGFHEDAIGSSGLRPRTVKKTQGPAEEREGWVQKYGEEGARVIEKTAQENMEDYEYLKQFKVTI
ncbi:hypothetical protein DRE_06813 [Drechslerella stenobrocha 248]|uniref:Sulfotransferase domain-containing protein n=1 Tax=Drechslerella stenobrocha 248 TaxID=1043628 RepID=W7I6L4_9PEZI|nr:hypothetical protein DRE_06813 [Drechslerella stenobrocha 248]